MTNLRIGHGYDVHRLTQGRRLILGGVDIPWEKGLLGHSDADVLVHAVMDALTGAARLGDIGKLFPDTDPRYAGISSLKLLSEVGRLLGEKGFAVVNIDATLLAQAPKVGPYRREMERNMAAALGVEPELAMIVTSTASSPFANTLDNSSNNAFIDLSHPPWKNIFHIASAHPPSVPSPSGGNGPGNPWPWGSAGTNLPLPRLTG